MSLSIYFGPGWDNVYHEIHEGQRFYAAFQVRRLLGIRSGTIRSRVSRENWRMEQIDLINPFRSIYLINLQGVMELIIHSKSPAVSRIKNYLVANVIMQHRADIRYRSADSSNTEE